MQRLWPTLLALCLTFALVACEKPKDSVRVGVFFGVDTAERWPHELQYMHERAEELGITLISRMTSSKNAALEQKLCKAVLDENVDVIIVMSHNYAALKELYKFTQQKGIKVVCYTRMPLNYGQADLFVGFDSFLAGRAMGQYLSETVPNGNYMFLRGDENDTDARDMYLGAREDLVQYGNGIQVLCDVAVPGWSPALAHSIVRDALIEHNGNVDAILAPSDQIAGACRDALDELGISAKIPITGFSADLDAIHRLRRGTQSMTILADYKLLARLAVDQAVQLGHGKPPRTNKQYELTNGRKVDALLVPCQVITPQNIESRIVEAGIYSPNQIYGYGYSD